VPQDGGPSAEPGIACHSEGREHCIKLVIGTVTNYSRRIEGGSSPQGHRPLSFQELVSFRITAGGQEFWANKRVVGKINLTGRHSPVGDVQYICLDDPSCLASGKPVTPSLAKPSLDSGNVLGSSFRTMGVDFATLVDVVLTGVGPPNVSITLIRTIVSPSPPAELPQYMPDVEALSGTTLGAWTGDGVFQRHVNVGQWRKWRVFSGPPQAPRGRSGGKFCKIGHVVF